MKALSAATTAADSYRAGVELGESLAPISPEVVFLFSTIHFAQPADLVEGILDALGSDQVLVIGSTGDGFFETRGVQDIGASALALNSEGKLHWKLERVSGLQENPANCTQTLLNRLAEGRQPSLVYMVADFKVDASVIEKVLEAETRFPVIGGLAADDNHMTDCTLYCGREALSNAVVGLAVYGDLDFRIAVSNSLTPIGQTGVVTDAEGATIRKVDDMSATDFIERATGKPVLQTDRGITSLAIFDSVHGDSADCDSVDGEDDIEAGKEGGGKSRDVRRLRSIVPDFSDSEEALGLFGGIESGKSVQVCLAEPDQIIREVYELAKREKESGFAATAALVVSCVGRKWLLGPEIRHELLALTREYGTDFPIAGFPSFGEIAPLLTKSGYSRNLFHNMTCVILLIGK